MRRTLPLLELDPDLGTLLTAERRAACLRDLIVTVCRLPLGRWRAGGDDADPEHAGLLLVSGVVSRGVVVSDAVSTELLGPGDLIRPWSLQGQAGMLRSTVRWN